MSTRKRKRVAKKKTRRKKTTPRVSTRKKPRKKTKSEDPPGRHTPRWMGHQAVPALPLSGMPEPLEPLVSSLSEESDIRKKDVPHEEAEIRKQRFLDALAVCGLVGPSCRCAGINRRLAQVWRKNDADFAEEWDHAYADSVDRLEESARVRAVDGVDHPVIYEGEITDTYKQYSDSLMSKLLNGHNRERFTERTETKHSGSIVNPTTLDHETKEDVVRSILGMISSKPDPT